MSKAFDKIKAGLDDALKHASTPTGSAPEEQGQGSSPQEGLARAATPHALGYRAFSSLGMTARNPFGARDRLKADQWARGFAKARAALTPRQVG